MTKKKKRIIAIVILIAMVVTTILGVAITVSAKDKQQTAYVYIGDSRTVQLDKLIGMSTMTDTFVIAKSGMGYNWWTHTGSTQLSEIRKNNPSYTNWIYIFNLGVNDLVNVDKYKMLLPSLESEATVYFLSVNPTVDAVKGIQCKDIEQFNNSIKPVCSNYIDSYSYLKDTGYYAKDGMHYDDKTYQNLYTFITTSVQLNEFLKQQKEPGDYVKYLIAQ